VAEPGLSFNPAVVLGGTNTDYDASSATGTAFGKSNVIPRSFVAYSDLRYLDNEQVERAKAKMRAIAAESLRGTHAEITFTESYPPMAETPGNVRLAEMYSKASEDAGFGPIGRGDPQSRGAGDVQFIAPYVDCLDGLGAGGNGAHTVNEDLDPASIERGTIRAAILLYRLTR
jgi:glutamate carboxypeptidase